MKLRTFLLGGLLTVAAAGLVGCQTDNTPPPTPLSKVAPKLVGIKQLWQASAGSGTDGHYFTMGAAASGNMLMIASADGTITALNRNSGNTKWTIDTGTTLTATPAVLGNLVYVPTLQGQLLAINVQTQKVDWKAKLSSVALAPPVVSGQAVYVHTHNDNVTAIDVSTGKELWMYDGDVPNLTLERDSAPVVTDKLVILGQQDGQLVALNKTDGKVVWQRPIALPSGNNDVANMLDIDSTPVVDGSMIYSVAYHGNLVALNLNNGQLIWQHPLSVFDNIAYNGHDIVVTDDIGRIVCFDASTGREQWQQSALEHRFVSAPVIVGNNVVVGDFAGFVHFLALNDGKLLARKKVVDSGIRAQPVVVDHTVYVVGNKGSTAAVQGISE